MTTRPGRRAAGATAIMAVACLLPSTAAAAPASPPGWVPQVQLGISGENVDLQSISATAGGEVWAAGQVYTGFEFRTLALRRHAGKWSRVSTPDVETAPAEDFLSGVLALSPSDVWMVGSSATSPTDLVDVPLVEHWDGAAVSIVPVPDPSGGRGAALAAVSGSASDLWAAGSGESAGFEPTPVVEHYDGASWRAVAFGASVPGCGSSRGSSLDAVDDTGIGGVYVGGYCDTAGGQIGFVAHQVGGVGGGWSLSATTPTGGAIASLSTAPDLSVWAAGTEQSSGGGAGWSRGLALHGSGSAFTAIDQPVPAMGVDDGFASICATAGDVVAVGTATSPQPPFAGFGAYTLSASTWRRDPVRTPFGGFGRLAAVTCASGQMLAAGFGIAATGGEVGLVAVHRG